MSASSYSGLGAPTDPKDATVTVHTLRVSHLEKIQNLLVRGDRRTAFQYAADEKLWAHAMVIASSIDKESWKEVVSEFIHTELANPGVTTALPVRGTLKPTMAGGYEGLKVAYSLYAGHGAASSEFGALERNLYFTKRNSPRTLTSEASGQWCLTFATPFFFSYSDDPCFPTTTSTTIHPTGCSLQMG